MFKNTIRIYRTAMKKLKATDCLARRTTSRLAFLPLLILVMLLNVSSSNAQLSVSKQTIDFGKIEKGSERIHELEISNNSSEDCTLLNARFPREYDVLFSSKKIEANGSITLRVKLNPFKEGTLKDKVDVFFTCSQKPIQLTLKADVEYLDLSENTPCPKFGPQTTESNNWEFELTVKNAVTGKPISKAEFRFINNGKAVRFARTNKDGQYRTKVPVAYYYLIAKANNYESSDTAMYVNRRNKELVLFLNPLKSAPESMSDPDAEEIAIVQDELLEAPVLPTEEGVESAPLDEPDVPRILSDELPEDQYKKNNLVFLVDVSQSMNQSGKLDVLKASMFRLTRALRSSDKVTIISYASNAEVLIESCAGNKTEQISKAITSLEAGGMTSGGKGFKMAYVKLKEAWIEGGNNQVIVVTDGAFRKVDHEGINKMAKKEQRKGSVTTVLAVKSTNYAKKVLGEITANGGGSLVSLDDFDLDQENLLDEIKKQSLKRR